MSDFTETFCTVYSVQVGSPTQGTTTVALYTHPAPQRQPLTTEQIAALESRRHRNLPPDFDYSEGAWFELGIRHGERAHGIGGDE